MTKIKNATFKQPVIARRAFRAEAISSSKPHSRDCFGLKNRPRNDGGFTLIEVLIALAILSIALISIMRSTSQNIRDNTYLQNKTIAAWVGTQAMNEIRAGVISTASDNEIKKETEMLGRKWSWQATVTTTPNPRIKKIVVDVFSSDGKKMLSLTSYIYAS